MTVINLTQELISIPSVSRCEESIAKFISSKLEGNVKIQRIKGAGPNIIAEFFVSRKAPTVVLNAHLDTVPATGKWDKEPFRAEVEENKLYGLGAADMKAGLAINIDLFNTIVKERALNVIFTAVSDEELISLGAYNLLRRGLKGDLCIITEPTDEKVMLGCQGRYVLNIEIRGRGYHGARPSKGINAIEDSATVIKALKRVRIRTGRKLGKGSLCILKIEGGDDTLTVPDRCLITVDRHVVENESKSMILNDFRKVIKSLKIKSKVKVSLAERETPFLEPYIIDDSGNLIKKFLKQYREFYKMRAETIYGKSVGDYNLFARHLPTIVFGPKGKNWHAQNEYVYIDSVLRCREFLLEFLRGLRETVKLRAVKNGAKE